MTVSDADISKALLISTRDGTYPDSEEILTTDLASSALRPTLQLISEVKETIEVGSPSQVLTKLPLISDRTDRCSRGQPK